MLIDDHPHILTDTVDYALRGSEYAVEAWGIIKRRVSAQQDITMGDLAKLEELLDRARDDVKGPELRVDLEQMRIY